MNGQSIRYVVRFKAERGGVQFHGNRQTPH